MRNPIRLLAMLTICTLAGAACDSAAEPLSAADRSDVFRPAAWEAAFAPEELTVTREGLASFFDPHAAPGEQQIRPLDGAELELYAASPSGAGPLVPLARTRSGPDGRFRIGPGPRTAWVLKARGEGYAEAVGGAAYDVPGLLPLPEGFVHFGVRGASRVAGVLRAHDGAPLPGETLLIESLAFATETVTDDAGRFEAVVPVGDVTVRGKEAHLFTATAPASAGDTDIEVVASPYEPIRGFVIAGPSEQRLAGAVVVHTAFHEHRTVTGPDGSFVLAAPRLGRIGAFAEGHGWASIAVPRAGDAELRLRKAYAIRGRVVDRNGEPVPHARILAAAPLPSAGYETVPAPLADEDGTFAISWLATPLRPGEPACVISAYRRGFGWAMGGTVTADDEGLELRLTGERTVSGCLTEFDGAPIAATRVELTWHAPGAVRDGPARDARGLSDRQAMPLGVPLNIAAQTGDDGRFDIDGLPDDAEGEVRFHVRGTTMVRELPRHGDQTVDVQLTERKTIGGRIVDLEGAAVPISGSVVARAKDHDVFSRLERRAEVDDQGEFVITDLPEGTYSVFAEIAGWVVRGDDVDAGATDLTLVAQQPRALVVEAVFPPGAEAQDVTYLLRPVDDPAALVRTLTREPTEEGCSASFSLVYAGRYDIEARAGRYIGRLLAHDVPDGERAPLRVELTAESVVPVSVVDASGRPVAGQLLRFQPVGRRAVVKNVTTDDDGRAVVEGLDEGDWLVRAERVGAPSAERRFRPRSLPPDGIELRIPAHGSLEVEVRGAAAAGAVIGLEDDAGRAVYAWTDDGTQNARFRAGEDGRIRLRGVLAGTIVVFVDREGDARERREVEIVPGAATVVRVE